MQLMFVTCDMTYGAIDLVGLERLSELLVDFRIMQQLPRKVVRVGFLTDSPLRFLEGEKRSVVMQLEMVNEVLTVKHMRKASE